VGRSPAGEARAGRSLAAGMTAAASRRVPGSGSGGGGCGCETLNTSETEREGKNRGGFGV
jgi:hypothetical protein